MASVDNRVVDMQFNNGAFESGVSRTLGTLAKLKNALNFGNTSKSLDAVATSASHFNLSGMSGTITGVSAKFAALATIGVAALAEITRKAVDSGIRIAKAFTIDPLVEGFKSYETQINAAQTIIANTGATLPQVDKQLSQLQTYANQTVYSFADMASAIGTFTAAGVKLVPATAAIKGMGNTAALSGASVGQLQSAMYQMSQALATGVIRLQDWNSLSNAGMGGQNVQKALKDTADTIKGTGPKMDAAIKKYGSFRSSLTSGWLTADVFSKAMGVMAGTVDKATGKTRAYTVAELKAKGYTQAHAVELHKLSAAAINSATQIRTYTQLTQALKEEVGTAWGSIFKTIFGNLHGATILFTAIHNVAENALTAPIYALNNLLKGVVKLGGREKVIDAFKNAFKALGNVIRPIKEAFQTIFPPATAQSLMNMITAFDNFTKRLVLGKAAMGVLRDAFTGIFAALHIGVMFISAVAKEIGKLFAMLPKGNGSFTEIVETISYFLFNLNDVIQRGDLFNKWFDKLNTKIAPVVKALGHMGAILGSLFKGVGTKGISDQFGRVTDRLNPLQKALHAVSSAFRVFADNASKLVGPAIQKVKDAFKGIGEAIKNSLKTGDFNSVLDAINTGLLGGILLLLRKFFKKGIKTDLTGGLFGSIKETFEGLTGSLKAMQTQLKVKTLLEIAGAIALLTVSVVALSLINSAALTKAMSAIAVGFGELVGTLAILTKVTGTAGFLKLPVVAASLILLAGAIVVLSVAVGILGSMDWDTLVKGLGAVGVLLAEVSLAVLVLSKNPASLISAGAGITAIAVGITILAGAVKLFGSMDWQTLAKGLGSVGGLLIGIALAARLMPKNMVAIGFGLLEIALAINGLYLAVKNFSGLSWQDMVKGLAGVAGSLVAIAAGLRLMPKDMGVKAGQLLILSAALAIIGKTMESLGGMSWVEIAKGLVALAGSLGVLALALNVMDGTALGSASLLIAAGALKVLVPVIQSMAGMKWGDIAKGLITLAGALGILVLAGLAAEFVAPGLLALGAAAFAIGAGLALAGLGITAIAAALTVLAAVGTAAVGVLLVAIAGFIALIPSLGLALAGAFVNFVVVIGKNAPVLAKAFNSVIAAMISVIVTNIPLLLKTLGTLITAFLNFLVKVTPQIVSAGFKLLMDLLQGIDDNIVQVTNTVSDIIVKFLNTLSNNLPRIIAAGVNLTKQLAIGIVKAIAGNVPGAATKAISSFVSGIAGGASRIVSAGIGMLGHVVSGIASAVSNLISSGSSAVSHFVSGIGNRLSDIESAGTRIMSHLASGITNSANNIAAEAYNAAISIGENLIQGAISGIGNMAGALARKASSVVSGALSTVKNAMHILSPSRVWRDEVGKQLIMGAAVGMDQNADEINKSALNAFKDTPTIVANALGRIPNALDGLIDMQPTITPVLDLTDIQNNAPKINSLLATTPINAMTSFDSAKSISSSTKQAAQDAVLATDGATPAVTDIKFEQNNYSPKALSPIEVYRMTKNQLSMAKTVLGVAP